MILTTHSPHVASIAPVRSIVLFRYDADQATTTAVSTARISLDQRDEDDLQRYIDVNRGELFFARAVVLVEGDAEKFFVPAFAAVLDIDLDAFGISVCSVGGTNFAPYVKLLGASGLSIPHVVLTDRDPNGTRPSRGRRRIERLLAIVEPGVDFSERTEVQVLRRGEHHGYFVNEKTLEVDLFKAGFGEVIQTALTEELSMGQTTVDALQGWVDEPDDLDDDAYLRLVERVGKGRFAQRVAPGLTGDECPDYIRRASERIRDAVT